MGKKIATNTTLQNKTKVEKLYNQHIIPKHMVQSVDTMVFLNAIKSLDIDKDKLLFNLGIKLVGNNRNLQYQTFLSEYSYDTVILPEPPKHEFDLLGIVYQFLNTKHENLSLGAFYTNQETVLDMLSNLSFANNETILDPSCGSGAFLFSLDLHANQITGVDFDVIAVMIAKFNFFLKFPDSPIYPQIYHADFLQWHYNNGSQRFDYVVGNPPYGANLDLAQYKSNNILTGESFSYFVEYGSQLLKDTGSLIYLLPEAFLNVKQHVDIRKYILENLNLIKIKKQNIKFSGVMSDLYQIMLSKKSQKTLHFITDKDVYEMSSSIFLQLKNIIFTPLSDMDMSIIEKVKKASIYTLEDSQFGLGVVTGDNKNKLLKDMVQGAEPIYTGKEIQKYILSQSQNYLIFDRNNLQQVAPDHIYRAEAKLLYQVINKKIKIAIDTQQQLTTASANIIIPKVPDNNIYSIAILLNSDLYSFLNQKMYGLVNKVSKENLQNLPIPSFSTEELKHIHQLVDLYSQGKIEEIILQDFVFDLFQITKTEQAYINNQLK